MTRTLLPLLVLCSACAPPPAARPEPSITLLYPSPDAGPLRLDLRGRLSFTVVVDLDGLTIVEPNSRDADVEGEGHWHLNLNGGYVTATSDPYYTYESDEDAFSPGESVSVSVTLASNTHSDLDQYEGWEDIAEFEVQGALGQ